MSDINATTPHLQPVVGQAKAFAELQAFVIDKGLAPAWVTSEEIQKSASTPESRGAGAFAYPGLPIHSRVETWLSLAKLASLFDAMGARPDLEHAGKRVINACALHGIPEADMVKAASAAVEFNRRNEPAVRIPIAGNEFGVNSGDELSKLATYMYDNAGTCRFDDRHAAAKVMLKTSDERGWSLDPQVRALLEKSAGLAEFTADTAERGFRLRQYAGDQILPLENLGLMKTATVADGDFTSACRTMEARDLCGWLHKSYAKVGLPEQVLTGYSPSETLRNEKLSALADDHAFYTVREKLASALADFGTVLPEGCSLDEARLIFNGLSPAVKENIQAILG